MDLQKMAAEFADAVMRVIQEATLDDLMVASETPRAKVTATPWRLVKQGANRRVVHAIKPQPIRKASKLTPDASKNGKVSEPRPTPVMRMLAKLAAKRDKASDKALALKSLKPIKTAVKKKPTAKKIATKKPSKKSKKAGRR